jgi:hypothetical protein
MKRRRSLYARPQPFSTIAVRRGAAWLARPSSCVGASGSLTLERWPAAEPSWLPSAAGAVPVGGSPEEHGWASQRAAVGRGGPGGADAGRAFVTVSMSSSGVRCERPTSTRACRATAVQCPVWASECPGVPFRCPGVGRPVSVRSRVRYVRPGDRGGWRWAGSRTAAIAGLAVARSVHDQLSTA